MEVFIFGGVSVYMMAQFFFGIHSLNMDLFYLLIKQKILYNKSKIPFIRHM